MMLAALLIVGAVLAIPMLYFCIQWFRLWREEQRQIRQLILRAIALPDNPSQFTNEETVHAGMILEEAYRLPCTLPSDMPQLSALWKTRREIRCRGKEEAPNEQWRDSRDEV